MNRSILIVICDFLLVSLLMFSTVDVNKATDDAVPRDIRLPVPNHTPEAEKKDLNVQMRLVLEAERHHRQQLASELDKTRGELSEKQALLTHQSNLLTAERQKVSEQEALLSERDQRVRTIQQELSDRGLRLEALQLELAQRDQQVRAVQGDLTNRQQQAERLQQEQAQLQRQLAGAQTNLQALSQQLTARQQEAQRLQLERANLQGQLASSRTNLQSLNQELHETTVQSVIAQEKLTALKDQFDKQAARSKAMEEQLGELERSNRLVVAEQLRLGSDLRVAETEKRSAAAAAAQAQEQVKIATEEKAKLLEGFKEIKELAAQSKAAAHEVHEMHEVIGLSANAIYADFLTNRLEARFSAFRSPGLIPFVGGAHEKKAQTVLVSDTTNCYVLCHIEDTPLELKEQSTDWEGLTGSLLAHNTESIAVRAIRFYSNDPRVLFIPVTADEARRLGAKAYRVAADPNKLQDAVLVSTRGDYYGECRFQVDLPNPLYVKLEAIPGKGAIGKFNPAAGDFVFSRADELIGIMVNGSYCLKLCSFEFLNAIQLGEDVRGQHTALTLSGFYTQIHNLPGKLQ